MPDRQGWQRGVACRLPSHSAPGRDLKYVLRVYDADGNFDETAAQPFWIIDSVAPDIARRTPRASCWRAMARAASRWRTFRCTAAPSRSPGATSRMGIACSWPAADVPLGKDRQVCRRGNPAAGHAHRRGIGARQRRQRRAVPARSGARKERLVLCRHCRCHGVESSTSGPAKLVANDNATTTTDLSRRPVGLLHEGPSSATSGI